MNFQTLERLKNEYNELEFLENGFGDLKFEIHFDESKLESKITILYEKQGRILYFPQLPIEMSEKIHSFNVEYNTLTFLMKYFHDYPFRGPYFNYLSFYGNKKIKKKSIESIIIYNRIQPHLHRPDKDIISFSSFWLDNITNPNKYLHA